MSIDSRVKATVNDRSVYVGDRYMAEESVVEVVSIIRGSTSPRYLLCHRVSCNLFTTIYDPKEYLTEEDEKYYIDMEIFLPPSKLPAYVCRPVAGPLFKKDQDDLHQITFVCPHSQRILNDIDNYK